MKIDTEHPPAPRKFSFLLIPWLVLGSGLLVTYGVQHVARQENRQHVQERFDFRFNEIVANIENRLRDYEDVLHGAKALFVSSESVSRGEFRDYVAQLQLTQRYPGIQGVGFSLWIPPADKDSHTRRIREEGFPDYSIRPPGARDTYTSIVYLEPFDWRNQRAFGYDMYSEAVRRSAMELARDENRTTVSGKVRLVQETDKNVQAGFLMYLPVYRNGLPHETLSQRRENLVGWVYAPFRMHDLMSGILGKHFGEIGNTLAFNIYDGETTSPKNLMYDFNVETGTSPGRHEPVFQSIKYIEVSGHPWTIAVRSLPDFEASLKSDDAQLITIAGITGSLLASFIAWLLVTGQERAFATASKMTRELRESESRTKRLNRALKMLSDCNMTLVRAEDEYKLLSEICRLIVERGGYRLAWVGYAEQDEAKTVRPVAQAGFEEGYLNGVNVTWADTERGRGPTGTAIRTGATDINQDYLSNPRMAPWREAALKRGYQSSIALPLMGRNGALGALTIYSPDPYAFEPEEVKLLEELAGDLAFGIETLRTRASRRQAEEKLGFLAQHDPLTQLPNRLLLHDRFDLAAAAMERERSGIAILFLDLDNFKQVNETLGHNQGDQLLIRIVERLQGNVRDTDTVSRQGGDEFAILLANVSDLGTIGGIAQNILEAFGDPIEIDGRRLNVSFSMGISVYPNDGTEFDTLLKQAETAMYSAKESGRNTYRFFNAQMNSDALEQLQLHGQLHHAVRNGELLLHYQPQVDIVHGGVTGFEALVRWRHPEAGLIPPSRFIPLAERSGLIIQIDEWVLNEACRQAKAWLDSGRPLMMAVNLSALQLKRGDLLETVANALERSGLPPHHLELELTETILLHDLDAAVQTLHDLKKMGVRLSIDDFGTGYSSLSYLKRLAVDKLKIDQSFVRDLTDDPDDAAIVKAIIQLGHTLQLSIIAEGVETGAQLEFLKDNGCEEVQGYFFSRPLPAEETPALFGKNFL